MQDGPLGIRFGKFNLPERSVFLMADLEPADYVSAFPSGMNVAATWDRNLARARGEAMGAENKAKGVDVQLGPVCGPLGRAPEGGRNWVSEIEGLIRVAALTRSRKDLVPIRT